MIVAVTGATGHLGANLIRSLAADGHVVRVLVHRDTRALEGLDLVRLSGDVRDPASLRPLFAGAELVYHLAAMISILGPRGGLVEEINVGGTRNVATVARECGVRRLVHTSSIHAFDLRPGGGPVDESGRRARPGTHPAYDCSKANGEDEVRRAIDQGLDAVIVNPSGIIGPHDHGPSRMGRFFLKLYRRELWALVSGGFDWVDVRDVVRGQKAAAERGRTGENYLLSGHWCSVRELAALAAQITGVPAPRFVAPTELASVGAPATMQLARFFRREPLFTSESLRALRASHPVVHDKATRELGYETTLLPDTVAAIYRWFGS